MNPPTQNGPFLVFPGGECVPIDGPLQIAELREQDAHSLAQQAMESLSDPELERF